MFTDFSAQQGHNKELLWQDITDCSCKFVYIVLSSRHVILSLLHLFLRPMNENGFRRMRYFIYYRKESFIKPLRLALNIQKEIYQNNNKRITWKLLTTSTTKMDYICKQKSKYQYLKKKLYQMRIKRFPLTKERAIKLIDMGMVFLGKKVLV